VCNALNKFCIGSYPRFQRGVQLTHSFLMFLNELDGCFNDDVVKKNSTTRRAAFCASTLKRTAAAAKALSQVSMKFRRIRQISRINSSSW
jgi:hypothetical protein